MDLAHIAPVIELKTLKRVGVFRAQPPQSIFRIGRDKLLALFAVIPNLGIKVLP